VGAATRDGPDTWLARLLLGSRRLDLPVLQRSLAESRRERRPLGEILVSGGHLPAAELQQLLGGYPGPAETPFAVSVGGPGSPRVGEVVDGAYRVLGVLGQGGMGTVYRVSEVASGRELALKVLLRELSGEVESERFRREAEAAARIGQRMGFVQIHSSGTHRGQPFYVMDIVEGAELESLIDTILPEELARVLAIVARSLSSFHQGGYVHRDLKPANVLLGSDGQPRIVDLGLVSDGARAGLTATGEVLGTPAYMAPEQVLDAREVDHRSDVYALGAILYRGLSGQPPFTGSLISILSSVVSDQPVRPTTLRPEVSPALEAVCLRAMAKDPDQRYPDTASFALDLERFLAGELRAPASSATPLWAGAGALLVLLGAVGFVLRGSGVEEELASSPLPRVTSSPTLDRDEVLAEVRDLIARKRFPGALRRSRELDSLPQDVRWVFALRELSLHLDRAESRRRRALEALEGPGGREEESYGDHRLQAVRSAYAPCHECLTGLEGDHESAARRELAGRLLRKLQELRPGEGVGLQPWQAEQGASLARLIRVLDPTRTYSPNELEAIVPSIPFIENVHPLPGVRFGEALVALAPDSRLLHQRVASWATQNASHEVQRRLLPVVTRALELDPEPAARVDLQLIRLGCLLEGSRDWDELLEEATDLLGEELVQLQRARALEYRARVHFRREHWQRALADLDASLEAFDGVFVRSVRARALQRLGRTREALEEAERILSNRSLESFQVRASMVCILWDLDREGPNLATHVQSLLAQRSGQLGWRLRLALVLLDGSEDEIQKARAQLSQVLSPTYAQDENVLRVVKPMRPEVRRVLNNLEIDPAACKRILAELVEKLDRARGSNIWP
jgi:serine/threonine protein kinase/DNA polymerase III psi subunit